MSHIEGLTSDILTLGGEVVTQLRESQGSFEDLSGRLQRQYEELGSMSLAFLVDYPETAQLMGKFGSNEEAFAITIADIDDALLRVHYYTGKGTSTICEGDLNEKPIDIAKFGTPHNHVGNISAAVPVGRLTHHLFRPVEGDEYTAGKIKFVEATDSTKSYKFSSSVFIPTEQIGLEPLGSESVEPGRGYWMHQDAVHVVSWDEPTITTFINDFRYRRPGTVYQQGEITTELERPRTPSLEERNTIWKSFAELALQNS